MINRFIAKIYYKFMVHKFDFNGVTIEITALSKAKARLEAWATYEYFKAQKEAGEWLTAENLKDIE